MRKPEKIQWVGSLALGMGGRETKSSPMAPTLSQNAHPGICANICARAAGELKWSALGWVCLLMSVREEV